MKLTIHLNVRAKIITLWEDIGVNFCVFWLGNAFLYIWHQKAEVTKKKIVNWTSLKLKVYFKGHNQQSKRQQRMGEKFGKSYVR